MNTPCVAVIDIGSNSIKILVARREADGSLVSLKGRTIDARISTGISKAKPRITEDGMVRGLAAIQELLADAAPFEPFKVMLVATSAVRDAIRGLGPNPVTADEAIRVIGLIELGLQSAQQGRMMQISFD